MVDYADIGKRIRACRLAKGMTQEQLANEVGVVVTHISHIETGNSVPSLKTLIDINIKQKILPLKSEKILVIADGAAFGPQMNDIYRLMQEASAKFSLYLPESLEWLLLKADLIGQPEILEILEHPADLIESSEFFSWERFFTNLLEQRTKDVPYMRYDKAKLPEFYLQEENLEKIIKEMG